jgi:hypothetical protein
LNPTPKKALERTTNAVFVLAPNVDSSAHDGVMDLFTFGAYYAWKESGNKNARKVVQQNSMKYEFDHTDVPDCLDALGEAHL